MTNKEKVIRKLGRKIAELQEAVLDLQDLECSDELKENIINLTIKQLHDIERTLSVI